jgi:hypothetical protein
MAFAWNGNLTVHTRTHSGEKRQRLLQTEQQRVLSAERTTAWFLAAGLDPPGATLTTNELQKGLEGVCYHVFHEVWLHTVSLLTSCRHM